MTALGLLASEGAWAGMELWLPTSWRTQPVSEHIFHAGGGSMVKNGSLYAVRFCVHL